MNYIKNLKMLGIEAKEIPCITGTGAPTLETDGAVGMFYMDEGSGKVHKRTATGWEPLTINIAVVDEEPDDLSDYADGDIILVTE